MRLVLLILALSLSCSRPQPVNPRALEQESACIESLQVEDYEGAKVRCELCLEYDDQVAACMNGMGLVAYARGDTNKATGWFTKAIKQSKNFAQARNNLGAIYFKNKNYGDAIPYFNAALRIDPGYEDARYNLGLSYLKLGQQASVKRNNRAARDNYQRAEKQLRKAIAINPGYVNAYRDLGLANLYQGSIEKDEEKRAGYIKEAVQYFEDCLQVDPGSEVCHESYGETLLFKKQYDAALQQFIECLAGNKKNSTCLAGTNKAYQGSQMKSKALKAYVEQLKKNPNDAEGLYGYCALLFDGGMSNLAIPECQKAVKLDKKICPAYYLLGMHYQKVLNGKEALANCQAFALCPGHKNEEKSHQCNRVITALSGS